MPGKASSPHRMYTSFILERVKYCNSVTSVVHEVLPHLFLYL